MAGLLGVIAVCDMRIWEFCGVDLSVNLAVGLGILGVLWRGGCGQEYR